MALSTTPDTVTQPPPRQRFQADLTLLTVAVIWGSAFVVQRVVASITGFYLFNGLRFLLACFILFSLAPLLTRRSNIPIHRKKIFLPGIILAGILLAGGAAFQQAGLRFTTAGNAGFITGLYVIFIPLVQTIIFKQKTRPLVWLAVSLAIIGLFLLSTNGQLQVNKGDLLELVGALFWALHVIWIGRLVQQAQPLEIAIGQYLVCGLLSLILGLILESHQLVTISSAFWAILYTGIFSVAIGYTLQIIGQKYAPPADAAIILSLEAVFAAFFGWIFLQETLSLLQVSGCVAMLAGMLLSQLEVIRNYHMTRRA